MRCSPIHLLMQGHTISLHTSFRGILPHLPRIQVLTQKVLSQTNHSNFALMRLRTLRTTSRSEQAILSNKLRGNSVRPRVFSVYPRIEPLDLLCKRLLYPGGCRSRFCSNRFAGVRNVTRSDQNPSLALCSARDGRRRTGHSELEMPQHCVLEITKHHCYRAVTLGKTRLRPKASQSDND